MHFDLAFTEEAAKNLADLEVHDAAKALKVKKTLGLMQTDLRSHGLQTHEFHTLSQQLKIKVFESYVENRTPAAFRVFWHYGPGRGSSRSSPSCPIRDGGVGGRGRASAPSATVKPCTTSAISPSRSVRTSITNQSSAMTPTTAGE